MDKIDNKAESIPNTADRLEWIEIMFLISKKQILKESVASELIIKKGYKRNPPRAAPILINNIVLAVVSSLVPLESPNRKEKNMIPTPMINRV